MTTMPWEAEAIKTSVAFLRERGYAVSKGKRKIKLSRTNKPQDIHADAWFYVNGRSIDIMIRHSFGTTKTRLPMKMLEKLLK